MKRAGFLIFVLIFCLVKQSDEFLLRTFQSEKCFTNNNSTSVDKLIDFLEISKVNCEIMIEDTNHLRSVHFAKIIGIPDKDPSVFLGTKQDTVRFANQLPDYLSEHINFAESNEFPIESKKIYAIEYYNL